jgi:hypothetical protein
MNVGTKSVLFGVHQFVIHPVTVGIAYVKLYGWTWDVRLWLAILLHDLGYIGKPNMDGPEGERHPVWAANVMNRLFGLEWARFCLAHSRFYAKLYGYPISRLCVADKLSVVITPDWLYLLLSRASGEIHEYRRVAVGARHHGEGLVDVTELAWLASVKVYLARWVQENRDIPFVGEARSQP